MTKVWLHVCCFKSNRANVLSKFQNRLSQNWLNGLNQISNKKYSKILNTLSCVDLMFEFGSADFEIAPPKLGLAKAKWLDRNLHD